MGGAVWMLAMRWFMRVIGLISTAILARLLMPEDFGLVAMAMVFVGLLQQLLDFGLTIGLLRNPDADRRHYDTTWTVQLIQMSGLALVLALCAPLIAGVYNEPRVTSIVLVVALGMAIRGWGNIGVIDFRKHLLFHKDFWFNVVIKIGGFVVTISLAWVLRSYWALVLGSLFNQIVAVALSYVMSSYRPRFSLAVVGEIWSFSQWMLVRGLANYIFTQGDQFIVGKLFASSGLGYYSVAKDIASTPAREIVQPVSRAFTPGFAKLQKQPERLNAAFTKALGGLALLTVPAGIGLSCVATEIVPLLLGNKWLAATPLLQWLPVGSVLFALHALAGNIVVVLGHVRLLAIIDWVRALALLICLYIGYRLFGLMGVVGGSIAGSSISFILLFAAAIRVSPLRWGEIARALARPLIAAGVMAGVLIMVSPFLALPLIALLGAKVALGALTYGLTLMLLWRLFGSQAAVERDFVAKIREKLCRT